MKNIRCLVAMLMICLAVPAVADDDAKPALVRGETLIVTPALGEGLHVHNVFQSNMVLQRDKPIAVWGWATPGETIDVSFAGQSASATAGDDRTWKVTLPAQTVNTTPQTMTITGEGETVTLDNILLGDVWVLGGQSNMEHPLSRCEDGKLEIASANFPAIRILTVAKHFGPTDIANFPRQYRWESFFSSHNREGFWDVCSPDVARDLSGIGYIFARRLHMATQVPIGVIDASVGGSTLQTWLPDELLRAAEIPLLQDEIARVDKAVEEYTPEKALADRIKFYHARTERLKAEGQDVSGRTNPPTEAPPSPANGMNRPGNCFAGIIEPLRGIQVKGVIWHQGYSNCGDGTPGTDLYAELFDDMIQAWRGAFDNPEMAFGILSLCTQGKKQEHEDFTSHMSDAGPFLRQVQYETFLKLSKAGDENIGFVSTYDLDRSWYHPKLKFPAGERAAKWALATQYDIDAGAWKPLEITGMTIEGDRLVLTLDGAGDTIGNGLPIQGFAIAGEDRRFHPADATFLETGKDGRNRPQYDRKTIVLTSMMVPKPVHYRFAWARMPMANVQRELIPMATQRSDDWPLEQTPDLGLELDEFGRADRARKNQIRKALEAIDAERSRAEAKAVLEAKSDSD